MIKKLLSLMVLLVLAATTNAQVLKDPRVPTYSPLKNSLKHATPSKMMKAKASNKTFDLNAGQAWFGYWNPEEAEPLGTHEPCDYALSIYVPSKVAGKGATVDGLRFYLPITTGISNVKAWVSTKLPEAGHYSDGADLEIKNVANVAVGYNEVIFDKSYEMPEGGLYVGFTFDSDFDTSDYPRENYSTTEEYYAWLELYYAWVAKHPESEPFMASFGDKLFEGSMYFASKMYDDLYRQYGQIPGYEVYLDYIGWDDYTDYGYYLGLEALIGGDKFLSNAASLTDFGEKYASMNSQVTFPVTITNSGSKGIKNFTYEVSMNGTKTEEKTITLSQPISKILDYTTENITFGTGDKSGKNNVEIKITKVNGEPNEMDGSAHGAVVLLTEMAQMKPLIEEYTGSWCGWCTRGWVGLEMLSKDFEGKAITVAAHNGDPMEIDEYTSVISAYIQGFPSMLINRVKEVDPYYGSGYDSYGVKNDVQLALADGAPLSIAVSANWADDAKTKINIGTETKFFYDDENPSVAIGYILVADGLSGTGRSWSQANYYSSYAEDYGDDPYLGPLTKMGSYIIGMEYNHVAVAGWGIFNGVNGSISGPVKASQPVIGNFEADLTGLLIGEDRKSQDPEDHVTVIDMIKDKKLSVVAFLINQVTGEILNADEVVLQDGAQGINDVAESIGFETRRYNLSGQQIPASQKGINIIRLSNGRVIKVIVK